MPTLYEVFFWIVALVTVFGLWCKFASDSGDYVSQYELDRLNGNKY